MKIHLYAYFSWCDDDTSVYHHKVMIYHDGWTYQIKRGSLTLPILDTKKVLVNENLSRKQTFDKHSLQKKKAPGLNKIERQLSPAIFSLQTEV